MHSPRCRRTLTTSNILTACLRRTLGVHAAYIDGVSNAVVRVRVETEPLQSRARPNQLKPLCHSMWRPYTYPDRLCIFEPTDDLRPRKPPDAVRRLGRPRIVWIVTVVLTIKRLLNLTRAQIHKLAQNHQNWFDEIEAISAYVDCCKKSCNYITEIGNGPSCIFLYDSRS